MSCQARTAGHEVWKYPSMVRALIVLAVSLFASKLSSGEAHAPPDPVGDLPEAEKDVAFADKAAACQACIFFAAGS